jgi:hypothetical protein
MRIGFDWSSRDTIGSLPSDVCPVFVLLTIWWPMRDLCESERWTRETRTRRCAFLGAGRGSVGIEWSTSHAHVHREEPSGVGLVFEQ